ncbi:MAG: 2Fe-2S iron-sulfur cluster-binding protein, partial [Thiotrichaceae bacterium]
MTQINRLSANYDTVTSRIDRNKRITFRFNNKNYSGFHGDTIASALLANDVKVIGRSFKYGRPRGIVSAGSDEPNAILQLGKTEQTQVPNVRATQQLIFEGLECFSTNCWPSTNRDLKGVIGKLFGHFLPPGFYYKTFMAPRSLWMSYEKLIRKGAGLGKSPTKPDPDIYDVLNQNTDILIIGAGPAGLAAALSAAPSGARIIIADEQNEFGGNLLGRKDLINGASAQHWIDESVAKLHSFNNVSLLINATVNGYHDHNFLTIHERLTDHSHDLAPTNKVRQRLHRVRAKQVILATGAHERPLVFANNDIPGCMLASAVSTYINRYQVLPGKSLLLMTNNDNAYLTAFDWKMQCKELTNKTVTIVDTRQKSGETVSQRAAELGIQVISASAIIEAKGSQLVKGAIVASLNLAGDKVVGGERQIECDTVATSGGWSPAVHLSCHTGGRPLWREEIQGFIPDNFNKNMIATGACNGLYPLADILENATEVGLESVRKSAIKIDNIKALIKT